MKKLTKGLEIKQEDLKQVQVKVQLFNGQHWRIEPEGKAYRFTRFYEKGEPMDIDFQTGSLEKIYPQIKLLFNPKGALIANRLNSQGRLLTNRENKWFTTKGYKEKLPNKRAMEVYTLLEAMEESEFVADIQAYLHQKQ